MTQTRPDGQRVDVVMNCLLLGGREPRGVGLEARGTGARRGQHSLALCLTNTRTDRRPWDHSVYRMSRQLPSLVHGALRVVFSNGLQRPHAQHPRSPPAQRLITSRVSRDTNGGRLWPRPVARPPPVSRLRERLNRVARRVWENISRVTCIT